jgi:hypothetical protein
MCLPAVPLLIAATVASTAASTAMSYQASQQAAAGARSQASAVSAADNYQAQVARNNAIINENNAQAAEQAGQTLEQNQRQKTAQIIGSTRNAQAANGLDTTSGTPASVQTDEAKLGELDALTIRSNAGRQAYGYRVEGMSDEAQARLDDASAKNAIVAGNIKADAANIQGVSSILSGATSLSDKFLGWQKQGLLT